MTPEEIFAAITSLGEALRSDLAASVAKLDERCTAIEQKADAIIKSKGVGSRRMDGDVDDPDDVAATRTAADSVQRAEFAALASTVSDLRKAQSTPMKDLARFDELQAKCDAVMKVHGERAEPPVIGETLTRYAIRQHKKMQPFSPRWKGVDLGIISADGKAFDGILADIRADALQAGLNPGHLPEFQYREIVEQLIPGGPVARKFVGRGSIFKAMSPPVRKVAYIGTRNLTGAAQ